MAEDKKTRSNRLALLAQVQSLIDQLADYSQIVGSSETHKSVGWGACLKVKSLKSFQRHTHPAEPSGQVPGLKIFADEIILTRLPG